MVVHDNEAAPDGTGSDPEPAAAVAAEIVAPGGRAGLYPNAIKPDGARAAVALATSHFGRLDVVVATAGVVHADPYEDWPAGSATFGL